MRDGEGEGWGGRTKGRVIEREGEGRLGKMSVGKGERRRGRELSTNWIGMGKLE